MNADEHSVNGDQKTARCQDAALTVEHAVMRCTFLKRGKTMKKTLIQKLGLLGVLSLLSYTAAVIFAPLAYPGYDWMEQAVSDLSAANAPSLALWNQLTAFYNVCEVVCVTVVCIGIQGQKTKLLRTGIYLFAAMEWVSAIGYRMFPLSDSGYAGAFQDVMHMVITAAVVLLSIVSLSIIVATGAKDKRCRSYGVCAAIALGMMLVGAVGMNSGIFNNPFIIWGRYHRGLFKATLPLSFQFHHTQMDGAHAGRFLQRLQETIRRIT